MKIKRRLSRFAAPSVIAVALTALLAGPSAVQGQGAAHDHPVAIAPFVGGGFLMGQAAEVEDVPFSFENAFGTGLSLSFAILDGLALEGFVSIHPTETSTQGQQINASFDTDLYMYGGGVRYYLPVATDQLAPYVAGGIGEKRYEGNFAEAETDFMWNVGGGLDVFTGWIADFRFDLRDYMSSFDTVREGQDPFFQNDVMFNIGVVFGIF